MIRKTSVEAYRRINDEGLVGPFQKDVYNIIYHHGPMTVGQISTIYKKYYPSTPRGRNECAKRVWDLQQFGVVYDTGKTMLCTKTKFNTILFDVNSSLPVKALKPTKVKCTHCNGKGHFLQEKMG